MERVVSEWIFDKDIKNPVSGKTKAFLKIPNAEIMDIFRKSVVRWLMRK